MFAKDPFTKIFQSSGATVGAAVCAPSQQPLDILIGFLMGHLLYRLSWQAQGQSPAGISDGASSHSQPGGVCPQALHLPAQHGVAGAMLASPGQTQWDGCCYAGVFRPCSLPPIRGWLHGHLPGVPAPQLCPLTNSFTSDCALGLQAAQEAVQEVLHAQASRDRLVAAADQQAAYQSYVPAAISGMGAAVANAASSIVGGGDVSACEMLNGDRQAGSFMALSCAG